MEEMNMNIEELRNAVEDRKRWRIKFHNVAQSLMLLKEREAVYSSYHLSVFCFLFIYYIYKRCDLLGPPRV
jgi:hypothetical protein